MTPRENLTILAIVFVVVLVGEYFREEASIKDIEGQIKSEVSDLRALRDADACRIFARDIKFTATNAFLPLEAQKQANILGNIKVLENVYCHP
jgi:hypothetical protein